MTEEEKIEKANKVTRTILIRLYPSAHQKTILKKWLGAARFIYNMVVEEYRQWENRESNPTSTLTLSDHSQLRILLQNKMNQPEYEWINVLPYDVRDEISKKAIIARTEVISRNRESYLNRHHSFKWQSLKEAKQTIICRHLKVADGFRIYNNTFHTKKMYQSIKNDGGRAYRPKSHINHPSRPLHPFHPEKRRNNHHWPNIDGKVQKDSTLTYHRKTNRWVFGWVYEKTKLSVVAIENQDGLKDTSICSTLPFEWRNVISCDPGIRAFQSYYSPTGSKSQPNIAHYGKIGKNDMTRIVKLCLCVDRCQSRLQSLTAKKRWRLRLAMARLRLRIKNLVDEMHKQTVHWMVKEYDTIILPKLDVHAMSKKRRDRRIQSKTVRQMMTWAHGRFRDRLISKCEEYEDGTKRVIDVNEAYTSMTCTNCGWVNRNLGGAEIFRCRQYKGGCGLFIDRDINGARNVYHLFLTFPFKTIIQKLDH